MSLRRPIVLGLVAVVMGSGLVAYRHFQSADTVTLSAPGVTAKATLPKPPKLAGRTLPDVPLQTFSGNSVHLVDLVGKPTVINVWQEACLPCKDEMPAFEAVHQSMGDRVRFVGIDSQDAIDRARAFAKKVGVTYDLWRDPEGQLYAALKLVALPSTLLVDATGHIVYSRTGAMTAEQLSAKLNEVFPT
jgi:peroxiredoxin